MNRSDKFGYLSLTEEIDETKNYYNDISNFKSGLNSKRKRRIVKSYFKSLDQCLDFILLKTWEGDVVYFGDWYPEYLLLGHFTEGLLRTILMKELSSNDFFDECYDMKKSQFKPLSDLIKSILKSSQIISLNQERITRIKNVLGYIRLQRNKQAHFHPKSYDTYCTRVEIYSLVKKMLKLFKIKFRKSTIKNLDNVINVNVVKSGLRFKPVWEFSK